MADRIDPAGSAVDAAQGDTRIGFHQSVLRQSLPIYYALVLAMLTGCAILMLWWLRDVLLLIFISLLFAAAVSRPSAYLERFGIPRGIAALMVYLAAFAILVAVGWFVVPPLTGQIARLVDEAPVYAERYERLREAYAELAEQYGLESFDEQIADFQARVLNGVGERLINLPTRLFQLFLDTLAVFVISMLVLVSRERLLAFTLSMVHPRHRPMTREVLIKMWERLGHYLRAKLIVMAIVGAITYGALWLIGVPFALILSIVVALGVLIPRVGPWIARIPLLTIALLEGWTTFGLTLLASIIIDNLKGLVISPFVEGDQLDIPPLLVFVAVPAAAMIQVLFEEVVIPWRKRQLAPAEAELAALEQPGQ